MPQDSEAAESLRHAMKRLEELTKAGGVYMDVYLVLSVLEFAFGGLLQRLPKLLPVVQTTVSLSCFSGEMEGSVAERSIYLWFMSN